MRKINSNFSMNKKGDFKNIFYGIIIFSALMIAASYVIVEQGTKYNSGLVSDLGSLNHLDEVAQEANTQKSSLSPDDPQPGTDSEANTFKGVYGILTSIFTPYTIISETAVDIGGRFQIPDYVITTIVTILLISITFGLIAIIFRLGKS